MCQEIHESVTVASKRLLIEMNRHNYVTPTSFLELLSIYSKLVKQKKAELTQAAKRLAVGLDKVRRTTQGYQISPKWDKTGTLADQISAILGCRTKMYWNLILKSPVFVYLESIWHTFGPTTTLPLTQTLLKNRLHYKL